MKNISFLYVLILASLLASCSATGNLTYTPERKYSPDQLREDVEVMEKTLKNNHPSLYWYSSKEEVDASFQKAYTQLTDSLNEIQFRTIIAETLFPIRCGHTSVRFSKNYYNFIEGRRLKTFPLLAKIIDDSSLVVTVNLNRRDSMIRPGTPLLSINGLSARQLIDSMLPLVSIDGYSKNFSYQNLSNNFTTYYNMRFGVQSSYAVEFLGFNGVSRQMNLPVFDPQRDTTRRRLPASTTPAPIPPTPPTPTITDRERRLQRTRTFNIDPTGTFAVLRINSFGTSLSKHYLKKSFRQLKKKKVEHLVIDVRNNGGGLIKTSLCLTRLVKQQPFTFADSIYATHRKLQTDARVYKRFVYNLGLLFLSKKQNDSMYAFKFFNSKQYTPLKNKYSGQVYLLTGGYSFSATTLFAAAVKGQSNVTIVGEETGGGYYGNNGVFIPEMILPNSKMRVRIPLYRIVNNKNYPKNGHGVLPDVEIKASAESIRTNRDPKLDKAIELIMQRKN